MNPVPKNFKCPKCDCSLVRKITGIITYYETLDQNGNQYLSELMYGSIRDLENNINKIHESEYFECLLCGDKFYGEGG